MLIMHSKRGQPYSAEKTKNVPNNYGYDLRGWQQTHNSMGKVRSSYFIFIWMDLSMWNNGQTCESLIEKQIFHGNKTQTSTN